MRPVFAQRLMIALTAILVVVGIASVVAPQALALNANDLGLGFATGTGLPTDDLRVVVAKIIRTALGLLGIIAVGICVWAGWRWMSSGGNEEQITEAKKWLTNGIIGLIIILLAFAIVTFVINRLVEATNGAPSSPCTDSNAGEIRGCYRCTPPSWQYDETVAGCFGGGDAFRVDAIRPIEDALSPMNTIVRLYLNRPANLETVSANDITIEKIARLDTTGAVVETFPAGLPIPIDVSARVKPDQSVDPTVIEVRPTVQCEGSTTHYCFDQWSKYRVTVQVNSFTDTDGRPVACGPGNYRCLRNFRVNDQVDTQPPSVAVSAFVPSQGQYVPTDSEVEVHVTATDNYDVSDVVLFAYALGANDALTPVDTETLLDEPYIYLWNTPGTVGQRFRFVAQATDSDSNLATSSARDVTLRPFWCFNGEQDSDKGETDIDCGPVASGCGACNGQACDSNLNVDSCQPSDSLCWSNYCNPTSCTCASWPDIISVEPDHAAPGTLVTLSGRFFGTTPGSVWFTASATPVAGETVANGLVKAKFPSEVYAQCTGSSWSDSQVVVVVPQSAANGPITLTTAAGQSDSTNSTRGGQTPLPDFLVTDEEYPGICNLSPAVGEFSTPFSIIGIKFGTTLAAVNGSIEFGTSGTSQVDSWADTLITSTVPNVQPDTLPVRVKRGSTGSNPYLFTVTPPALPGPIISYFRPTSGGAGQYVTIVGQNFGRSGVVEFVNRATGARIAADIDFPDMCAASWWRTDQIIVKVPAGAAPTGSVTSIAYSLRVTRADQQQADSQDAFTANQEPPTPGVCRLLPDNGPANTTVYAFGENFGNTAGTVEFWENESASVLTWATSGESVKTSVPSGALTGPVSIINSAGVVGNPVNFRVGVCTQNVCNNQPTAADCTDARLGQRAVGAECWVCTGDGWQWSVETDSGEPNPACFQAPSICCGDGVCRDRYNPDTNSFMSADQVCTAGGSSANYVWAYTTGDLPDPPRVIEECNRSLTCAANRLYPSPSPWTPMWDDSRGYERACVNTGITARFTKLMNETTLNSTNILIQECGGAEPADEDLSESERGEQICAPASLHTPLAWTRQLLPFSKEINRNVVQGYNGFFILPTSALRPNTYYQVTLKAGGEDSGGIRSAGIEGNDSITEDYIWRFRTRESSEPCDVGCVEVMPDPYTATARGLLSALHLAAADSEDNACIILNPSSYNWDWWTVENRPSTPVQPPRATLHPVLDSTNHSISYLRQAEAIAETVPGYLLCSNDTNQSCTPSTVVQDCCDGSLANCTATCNRYNYVSIYAKELASQSQDYARLTIDFTDPQVIAQWPDCDTACINGAIGGAFNVAMQSATVNPSTVQLYACVGASVCQADCDVTNNVAACQSSCATTGDQCATSCDTSVPACISACTTDVPGCISECAPGDTDCISACGTVNACQDACGTVSECRTRCEGVADSCSATCQLGHDECVAQCGTNEDCLPPSLVAVPTTVSYEECTGDDCANMALGTYPYEFAIHINQSYNGGKLLPNTSYRAWVGANLQSTSGVRLGNLNYQVGGPNAGYSWVFSTKNDAALCAVDRVELAPLQRTMSLIPDWALFRGRTFGAPDQCSPYGQRLNEQSYAWEWSAQDILNLQTQTLPADYTGPIDPVATVASLSGCGDGVVSFGEDCDDGNQVNFDGCSALCLWEGSCVPSSPTDTLCSDGRPATCRNAVLDWGEECDLGAVTQVTSTATNYDVAVCDPTSCLRLGNTRYGVSVCGNGIVEAGETCDTGAEPNGDDADGCTDRCVHTGSADTCGDGQVSFAEDCETCWLAGGTSSYTSTSGVCSRSDWGMGQSVVNGDGCSATCRLEPTPAGSSYYNIPSCGNGRVDVGEDCDDHNTVGGDGCSARCLNEGSSYSSASTTHYSPAQAVAESSNGGTAAIRAQAGGWCQADPLIACTENTGCESVGGPCVNYKSGRADLTVLCEYSDSECADMSPAGTEYGADTAGCCRARPHVREVFPTSDGVCRNTVISAQFDQIMNQASFTNQVAVEYLDPDGSCDPLAFNGGSSPSVWQRVVAAAHSVAQWFRALFAPNAQAAPTDVWCPVPGNPTTQVYSYLDSNSISRTATEMLFNLQVPLPANAKMRVRLGGGIQSLSGVAISRTGTDYTWQFSTGGDICTLDSITLDPATASFFSPDEPLLFTLTSLTSSGMPIQPILSTYHWNYLWTLNPAATPLISAPVQNVSQQTLLARNSNGFGTLTAEAVIDVDTVTPGGIQVGVARHDTADIITLMCENPWPPRRSATRTTHYFPFEDSATGSWTDLFPSGQTNFRTYYCRDAGGPGTADDLPALVPIQAAEPAADTGNLLRHILFVRDTGPGQANDSAQDAVILSVEKNLNHYSPELWFRERFGGQAGASFVRDGYQGVRQGNTVYVNAANYRAGTIYTNIYILGLSEGANSNSQQIYEQLLNNLTFNTNRAEVTNEGLCKTSGGATLTAVSLVCTTNPTQACTYDTDCGAPATCTADLKCSNNQTQSCTTDSDCLQPLCRPVGTCSTDPGIACTAASAAANCGAGATCNVAPQPIACSSDVDCYRCAAPSGEPTAELCQVNADCAPGACLAESGVYCNADKDKLARNVKRAADIHDIRTVLQSSYTANKTFPLLQSGSYQVGKTFDVWPSWQATLGNELGTSLPVDPLHQFIGCPAGYNATTCWDNVSLTFSCPREAYSYLYYPLDGGKRAEVTARLEPLTAYPAVNCGGLWDCSAYEDFLTSSCTNFSGYSVGDTDQDGVGDAVDNCVDTKNGYTNRCTGGASTNCCPFDDIRRCCPAFNPNISPTQNPDEYALMMTEVNYLCLQNDDSDSDSLGNACDLECPHDPNNDPDNDNICAAQDSCWQVANPIFADSDLDCGNPPFNFTADPRCGDACDVDCRGTDLDDCRPSCLRTSGEQNRCFNGSTNSCSWNGFGSQANCCGDDPGENQGVERCFDGVDNNCNGLIDETEDVDGDGYRNYFSCQYELQDCDDGDAAVNPGATEICGDGIDNNCNGLSDLADGCVPVDIQVAHVGPWGGEIPAGNPKRDVATVTLQATDGTVIETHEVAESSAVPVTFSQAKPGETYTLTWEVTSGDAGANFGVRFSRPEHINMSSLSFASQVPNATEGIVQNTNGSFSWSGSPGQTQLLPITTELENFIDTAGGRVGETVDALKAWVASQPWPQGVKDAFIALINFILPGPVTLDNLAASPDAICLLMNAENQVAPATWPGTCDDQNADGHLDFFRTGSDGFVGRNWYDIILSTSQSSLVGSKAAVRFTVQ